MVIHIEMIMRAFNLGLLTQTVLAQLLHDTPILFILVVITITMTQLVIPIILHMQVIQTLQQVTTILPWEQATVMQLHHIQTELPRQVTQT